MIIFWCQSLLHSVLRGHPYSAYRQNDPYPYSAYRQDDPYPYSAYRLDDPYLVED